MQNLQAVPPHSSQHQLVHVPSDLLTQSYVLVRHDAVRKPLQPPYDGLYRVISHTKNIYNRNQTTT